MSVLILQNEIVHYEVLGRGRPLLFLHGWVGSWRYWMPAMQAASISFRTYALDLWGFGDTAKNPHLYAMEEQVNLIDLFMQEMGIAKIALVGHGLGAIVAAQFAQQHPKWVDRLMAVCLPEENRLVNPRLLNNQLPELAEWLLTRSPEAEAARTEAPKADARSIQISLDGIERTALRTLLQDLKTPSLFVFGQNDPLIATPAFFDLSPELPEHIHHIVFEATGHFPMLDDPSKFNRLLTDFLALGSGISPRQLQLKEEWKRRVR